MILGRIKVRNRKVKASTKERQRAQTNTIRKIKYNMIDIERGRGRYEERESKER
jgi:hypothetical protein